MIHVTQIYSPSIKCCSGCSNTKCYIKILLAKMLLLLVHNRQLGFGLVELPHIQLLVFLKALLDIIRLESLRGASIEIKIKD